MTSPSDISIISSNGDNKRIKLEFFPAAFSSYQVLYRADLAAEGQVIPFSLTPGGVTSSQTYRNTVFNVEDPTPRVNLYVDASGPRGFFSITLLVTESEG